MSETLTLTAEPRERAGKGAARATRRAGRVPAVIYGDKKDPAMISLDPIELTKQMRATGFFSHIYELQVGGKAERVLARDVQFHPVTDEALHVDFMRVGKGSKVTVSVAVSYENEEACPGVKKGGVLNVVRTDVELSCSPEAIPEVIAIDLTGLEIGDSIRISDANLPGGVEPTIKDRDFMLASIAAPTIAVETEETDEDEGDAMDVETTKQKGETETG